MPWLVGCLNVFVGYRLKGMFYVISTLLLYWGKCENYYNLTMIISVIVCRFLTLFEQMFVVFHCEVYLVVLL